MIRSRLRWDEDPSEISAKLDDALGALSRDADLLTFKWLLAAAEDAAEVGLQPIAERILRACRAMSWRIVDGDSLLEIVAHTDNLEGMLTLGAGQVGSAVELFRSSIDSAQRAGLKLDEALARQNLASALWQIEGVAAARDEALLALGIYEELDDRLRRAQMLINLANYDLDEGRPIEAQGRLDVAEALATGAAARSIRTSILGTRAAVARALGELELAGSFHRQVLKRVRRGETLGRTRTAVQNMGAWYAEAGKPRLAAVWLGRAAALAFQERNPSLAANLLRSQAVQLMSAGVLEQAEEVMRSAVLLSDQAKDARGVAEGRADLAAVLLAVVASPQKGRNSSESKLREADELLQSALGYFHKVGDRAWLNHVQNNSVSLSLARGNPTEALERLTAHRDSLGPSKSAERLALDRRGMWLSVTEARRPELALSFARDAADLAASGRTASDERVPGRGADTRPSGAAAAAWELALGGALLREYSFAVEQAITLFREAENLAGGDDALRFHIVNDLGLAYETSGDRDAAIDSFDRCLQIAMRHDDRYMRQQALANRGEISRRLGATNSVLLLRQAADLARELLDVESEASSLLNLAWAHIDRGDPSEAEHVLAEVQALVDDARVGTATRAKVESARGGIASARADYQQSCSWHLRAASHLSSLDERLEALASAMLSATRAGDRVRYRALLDRIAREGQRANLDGRVAELICPCGAEWVAQRAVRLAARTFADAILLGLSQSIKDGRSGTGNTGDEPRSTAASDERFLSFITAIALMNAAVTPFPDLRPRLIHEVLARIRRQLTESHDGFVPSWIEQLANESWEAALAASPGYRTLEYWDLPPERRGPAPNGC